LLKADKVKASLQLTLYQSKSLKKGETPIQIWIGVFLFPERRVWENHPFIKIDIYKRELINNKYIM
jgi:hypothetical protein